MTPPRRPQLVRTAVPLALPGLTALAAVAALALSSCSAAGGGTAVAAGAAPTTAGTVPVSPVPPPPVTTSAPATTAPPTAPDTTAPPTTEAPSTTASTTTTTLPRNVEIVGESGVPIEVVGTSDGPATAAVQQRLLDLGFWVNGVDGTYGLTTRQGVMAFQKYLGLAPTGKVDEATAAYLAVFPERAHGRSDTGDLIEVDKTRQLLFVIRDGRTVMVLNTSTGTGEPYEEPDKKRPGEIQKGVSITPNGLWKVDRERPEGWWEGDLGEIYRPKYFRGGVAVHGSGSIPGHPASHGCVRVSVPAMDMIWELDLMPMGTTVWVHGEWPGSA